MPMNSKHNAMKFFFSFVFFFIGLVHHCTESTQCDLSTHKWTGWYDGDSPYLLSCDCETLTKLRPKYRNEICCHPSAAESRRIDNIFSTNSKLHYTSLSTESGFRCEQKVAFYRTCSDYEVRFCCEKSDMKTYSSCEGDSSHSDSSWTSWYRLQDLEGKCNCGNFTEMKPRLNEYCYQPSEVEVRTSSAAKDILPSSTTSLSLFGGFQCQSEGSRSCSDYEIRYKCLLENSTTASPYNTTNPISSHFSKSLTTNEPTTTAKHSSATTTPSKTPSKINGSFSDCLKYVQNNKLNPAGLRDCIGRSGFTQNTTFNYINGTQQGAVLTLFRYGTASELPTKVLHRFSATSVNYVRVANNSISQIDAVLLQFMLSKHTHENLTSEYKEDSSALVVKNLPLQNIPVLSISVFDKATNKEIQANVSYSIDIRKATAMSNLISKQQNASILSQEVIVDVSYECSFYDPVSQVYSRFGCTTKSVTATQVTCDCNHTTIFAVLLSVESYTVPYEVKVISFVTESISIVCLFLTLIALNVVRRHLSTDRTVVQINLTVSVLLLHLINVFHDFALRNDTTCKIIAVLLHYFLLATITWMFVEGLNLVVKTTKQSLSFLKNSRKTWTLIRLCLGWGIPFIIVSISGVIGFATDTYMERVKLLGYTECWLNSENGVLMGAALIPAIIIYCINVVIIIRVMIFIYKLQVKAEEFKPTNERRNSKILVDLDQMKAIFKAVLLLFPVIGISWIFSFLTSMKSYEVSTVFMYLNVIFNGLQGFFLMLVYCLFGSEVRTVWMRKINQKLLRLTPMKGRERANTGLTTVEMNSTK